MAHNVNQDDNLHVEEWDEQDRRFDVVRVKYINVSSGKSNIY